MDDRTRRLLARARSAGERTPDDDDEPMLLAWLACVGPDDPPSVNRYLTEIWRERVDLWEAYPGLFLDPAQRIGFLQWAEAFASEECGAPPAVLPPTDRQTTLASDAAVPLQPGVTVVGYFRSTFGIAAAARRLAELLHKAGEPTHLRSYDHTSAVSIGLVVDNDRGGLDSPAYDVTILCVNGLETPRTVRALGPAALTGRHRIGLWFWETEFFPNVQAAGFAHVDEVWVTSEFVRNAVGARAPAHIRIEIVPLGTSLLEITASDVADIRARIGVHKPTRIAGFTFDHSSRLARKNPIAVVEAFVRAIPTPDPQRLQLVIKTLNASQLPEQHATLLAATNVRTDIRVIDAAFSDREQQAFIQSLDCYISLPRSEGYGLTMLEAMARGIPVIATGYSGHLAFMDVENSWLIPYDRIAVVGSLIDPADPYTTVPGSFWADPDVDEAARALKEILAGGPGVEARIERARTDALNLIDGRGPVDWVRNRLAEIRSDRRTEELHR